MVTAGGTHVRHALLSSVHVADVRRVFLKPELVLRGREWSPRHEDRVALTCGGVFSTHVFAYFWSWFEGYC